MTPGTRHLRDRFTFNLIPAGSNFNLQVSVTWSNRTELLTNSV